jgi:diphosphomevalonate decarboxylase
MSQQINAASAIAHSNIALVKYWGKADVARNLPAVPSLSLTLDGLSTRTTVEFDAALAEDELSLGGSCVLGRPLARASALLDEVRGMAGLEARARIVSHNDFPTASGLASSASGFAALSVAASAAAGLDLDVARLSALARRASASAARSLLGGFAVLRAGAESAEPLADQAYWPLRMLVAVTSSGPKATSSTAGMQQTALSSPYYEAWVRGAPELFQRAASAVMRRDLAELGEAMEASTLMMHACMMASRPSLLYLSPVTLRVMGQVASLRASGVSAYCTMDAGPHVKVLTDSEGAPHVEALLRATDGVLDVISCGPGGAARLIDAPVVPC